MRLFIFWKKQKIYSYIVEVAWWKKGREKQRKSTLVRERKQTQFLKDPRKVHALPPDSSNSQTRVPLDVENRHDLWYLEGKPEILVVTNYFESLVFVELIHAQPQTKAQSSLKSGSLYLLMVSVHTYVRTYKTKHADQRVKPFFKVVLVLVLGRAAWIITTEVFQLFPYYGHDENKHLSSYCHYFTNNILGW